MNLVGAPAPHNPQIPPQATKSTYVPSSLVQAHSALALLGGLSQLPVPAGEVESWAIAGGETPQPPSWFSVRVGSKGCLVPGERGPRRFHVCPEPLHKHSPSLAVWAPSEGNTSLRCPNRYQAAPTDTSSSVRGPDRGSWCRGRGILQASPVLPLCPPWGAGRVGEERSGEPCPKGH